MRVVYFNYEWDLREAVGAAAHIYELSSGLRRLGHEVIAIDRRRKPAHGDSGSAGSASRSRGWRARLAPYLHEAAAIRRALGNIRREQAILEEHRPDVLLTRYSLHQVSSLIAARRLGLPIVFEVNAPAAYEYRRYLPQYKLLPGLGDRVEEWAFRRADGMFVVSSVLKRHFVERGVPAERIAVVPNGADPDVFRPDVSDAGARGTFGGDDVVIGFVGSFSSFHGIEVLKQVVAGLCPREPRARFLFVGEGTRSHDLREFCRASGYEDRVRFTGHVAREHVPALMAATDILVAPYSQEPFFYFSPIKLFEYMACGRAIVATRIGQIGDVIEDGRTGLLYEPDDTDGMIAKLSTLIRDQELRSAMGRRARSAVETDYSWTASARKVAALLEGAVARHRTRPHSLALATEERR